MLENNLSPNSNKFYDHIADFISLNDKQLESVENIDGPLLVLAGAGTGKTKVLTTRIANILLKNKAEPYEILAVTFTNKAAKEMQNRISEMVSNDIAKQIWIGTFHSISVKILRKHSHLVGIDNNFNIIDTDDQTRLLKQILSEHNIDEKEYPAKIFAGIISKWKDKALLPNQVRGSDGSKYANGVISEIYSDYQDRLKIIGAMDFGDLLLHTINIFNKHADILKRYQNQFKYILVDEYQDTNVSQYLWLRLLISPLKNICCVGDDDQSIYGWRGAEVGNILRFEKDFSGAKVIRLEQNYRSTNHILKVASNLIAVNNSRFHKELWTDNKKSDDEKVKIIACSDDFSESLFVAGQIKKLCQNGVYEKDIAILVRASSQTRSLEEAFLNSNINYKIIGGMRFYERKEIKDIIAYIRAIIRENDDLAFTRIINIPKRSVGDSTMALIYEYAGNNSLSLQKSVREMLDQNILKSKVAEALSIFMKQFSNWREQFRKIAPKDVVKDIIENSGYKQMLLEDKTIESSSRLENLNELLIAIEEFDNIELFLEHISLVSDSDNISDENMVNVMTLHSAKGLEFDHVFLPGFEEGVFPNQRVIDETGEKGIEEERRLAYVGITRAKKSLYISYAAARKRFNQWEYNQKSRFVSEILDSCTDNIELIGGNDFVEHRQNYYYNGKSNATFETKSSYGNSYRNNSLDNSNNHQVKNYDKIITNFQNSQNREKFSSGDRVSHEKFGVGTVKSAIGDVLEIIFDQNQSKKIIMAKFVKKQ